MKSQYLYHGSSFKVESNFLIPKKPTDLGEDPDNLHQAIYASDLKEIAIAMAIISCKGVQWSSLSFLTKPYATIYKGWPIQKSVFLYILPSDTFIESGGNGHQLISKEKVNIIKCEELLINDYKQLVRTASDEETKQWEKKFKDKL